MIPAKVEKIGAKAFNKCSSVKKVVIKSKKLKSVGKKAFGGIKKGAVIKVPKAKKAAYKKMLEKSKLAAKTKIK